MVRVNHQFKTNPPLTFTGTLDVRVRGNTLIPSSIFNRFFIICAILRQVHLVLQITAGTGELDKLCPDIFFIDQLSACIPLLRILCGLPRILFYCHFPDKLLARRQTLLKRVYRIPFDALESWSTDCADLIVVNSNFTAGVFADAFPALRDRSPKVVYPCVDTTVSSSSDEASQPICNSKILLSINRFERTKGLDRAIRAFALLPLSARNSARLVLAGGYDPRLDENVSTLASLRTLADELNLTHATATGLPLPEAQVLFLPSIPSALKSTLLRTATLLVYTPKFEHFGIVPLEAMLARLPVLAARTGGPRETVVEGDAGTGWLRDADDIAAWTAVMSSALRASRAELSAMGQRGRARVMQRFSKGNMAGELETRMGEMATVQTRPAVLSARGMALLVGVTVLVWGMLVAQYVAMRGVVYGGRA